MSYNNSVAILIDGSFFLKRYRAVYKNSKNHKPPQVASTLYTMVMKHVGDDNYLYRIFYYDCFPLSKKAHNPINKKSIDFSKSPVSDFRLEFFDELKKRRKVALRLGYLSKMNTWLIRPDKTKELLNKSITINDLTENDVFYETRQKGVDIKIGIDIASLAYKKCINQIVLISGDCDFVPAAKLARREGIDFILDPMWNNIDNDLFEHIDGLKSTCPKPQYMKKNEK